MSPDPILVDCEGAAGPVHAASLGLRMTAGICSMCGVIVSCDAEGRAVPHQREDILAMLDRGDFDRDR